MLRDAICDFIDERQAVVPEQSTFVLYPSVVRVAIEQKCGPENCFENHWTKISLQDDDVAPSKVLKKPKEQRLDASLFDDDVDIFADLTPVMKPKEKKAKKKVETKSIFDDDMGKLLLLEGKDR